MRWLFLILAAICEMLWFYCIAYLNKFTFEEITHLKFLQAENGWWGLGALVGYAGFGAANIILFGKAIQKIAPAVAFAVWTGLSLVGITITDMILKGIILN